MRIAESGADSRRFCMAARGEFHAATVPGRQRDAAAYQVLTMTGLWRPEPDAAEAMMLCTYDRSTELGLALVAAPDLSGAHYVPLQDAPAEHRNVRQPYLRQLHAVANSVPCGLTVTTRMPFRPDRWEMLTS
ncbi:hypothetical protein LDO26_01095 [Luteimonas sp. BDR2-5]|uniref:hypothetical protein n=1 Tax=Proluteimonas luteida TaxID=2878685 RepID=UPI001E521CDF|nr:hypothetical protein [Luteimonas sp. BDR2-5]MCD9026812.1 hypothetical protein [Luteimonas sp. BDR2-5]